MLKEFRDFAMRGNVMDLAIAVIIGGAFGKIIASLVKDILMPLIGLLLGGITFSELFATVNGVDIMYGLFIQAIIDFIVIAFVIFMLVRTMNNAKKKEDAAPADPSTKECQYCFSTVPIKATRCPHCTSQL